MNQPHAATGTATPAKALTAATIHLDAVRGAAALAVVAFHIRYKFFLDYAEAGRGSLPTTLFYAVTSFGHDAVMVFFVLSGYLISGTVIRDMRLGRWSWSRYLLNRLTRLYVVLLPGLALTVGWDLLGLHLFPTHPAYSGAVQVWKHDFFDVRAALTPAVFLANAAFRQAVAGVPPLGSNSPLWSLTYEFAYYLMFPAAALALWRSTAIRGRVLYGVIAGWLAAYYFGGRIVLYFPIWLLGFAVHLVPPLRPASTTTVRVRNAAAVVMVAEVTVFRHTSMFARIAGSASLEIGDFAVGLAFAVALYVLLLDTRPAWGGVYPALAKGSAHISYTLYVVHMPFLIFLRAWLNDGPQWAFGAGTGSFAVAVFTATVAYAACVWLAFEGRTSTIRALVGQRFGMSRSDMTAGV